MPSADSGARPGVTTEDLAQALESDLLRMHGPLLGGQILYRALGYASATAFRQALAKRTHPVPVFGIERRKGKFALTKDVATWLARQRCTVCSDANTDERIST